MSEELHVDILEATQSHLRTLDLIGIDREDIVVGILDPEVVNYHPGPPGVLITPVGQERYNPTDQRNTNASEWIEYPVGIALLKKYSQGKGTVNDLREVLSWRRVIREALTHKPENLEVEGAPNIVNDIEWIPGRIFAGAAMLSRTGLWLSLMSFMVGCHHLRERST